MNTAGRSAMAYEALLCAMEADINRVADLMVLLFADEVNAYATVYGWASCLAAVIKNNDQDTGERPWSLEAETSNGGSIEAFEPAQRLAARFLVAVLNDDQAGALALWMAAEQSSLQDTVHAGVAVLRLVADSLKGTLEQGAVL